VGHLLEDGNAQLVSNGELGDHIEAGGMGRGFAQEFETGPVDLLRSRGDDLAFQFIGNDVEEEVPDLDGALAAGRVEGFNGVAEGLERVGGGLDGGGNGGEGRVVKQSNAEGGRGSWRSGTGAEKGSRGS
jgi:hypothetical protein